MALFEARGLVYAYRGEFSEGAAAERMVLDGVSFCLEAGGIYDLRGPSGSGKSTLLRVCARLLPLQGGELVLDGRPSGSFAPTDWRRRVCLVPQKTMLAPGTIRENLLLPFTLKANKALSVPSDDELEDLLRLADVDVPLDRDASRLSGGQAARISLLRVFAMHPEVMLLDEVDAGLDEDSARAVGRLTKTIVGEHATCLRIRHREPDGLAQGTFVLEDGALSYREGSERGQAGVAEARG